MDGIGRCKLLSNEVLLYRQGSICALGLQHNGRQDKKRMCVCVCVCVYMYIDREREREIAGSFCCSAEIEGTL